MNGKSKKVVETERWVDEYITKNGFPPSYEEVKVGFGISLCAAWNRCNKFRDKMKQTVTVKREKAKFTKVKIEYMVPEQKFERFSVLLGEINILLKE